MMLNEKKAYLVKLLIWIWLIEEKINTIALEVDKKQEWEIDEIIIKLEEYYQKQNLADAHFLQQIEKINNAIDESLEATVEKFEAEKIIL